VLGAADDAVLTPVYVGDDAHVAARFHVIVNDVAHGNRVGALDAVEAKFAANLAGDYRAAAIVADEVVAAGGFYYVPVILFNA
jgi:hypothetical protein